MKITLTDKPKCLTKVVDDIPCGTVFSGSIFAAPSTYLRFFNGCVDLMNPDVAWTFKDHPGRTVENYEKLDAEIRTRRARCG